MQEGVIKCARRLHYYNPESGSAFNFFTKVARSRAIDVGLAESRHKKRLNALVDEMNIGIPNMLDSSRHPERDN